MRVGVFARSVADLAGIAKGFYADENLDVQLQQVTGSVQQFTSLRDGLYDLIVTSPDNIANYNLNPTNALGALQDNRLFAGVDQGQNLVFVTQPDITSCEQFAGRVLGVDSAVSGFAFVVYKILQQCGLERNVDYSVVSVGGVSQRYNALIAGTIDGAILSNGFDVQAAANGKNLLDPVAAVADPYLAVVAAAKTSWIEANEATVVKYIKGYYRATQWAYDPANREEAITLLQTQLNTSREQAELTYDIQTDSSVGLIPDAAVSSEGLLGVLSLRQEFGGFQQEQDVESLSKPGGGLWLVRYYVAARFAIALEDLFRR